MTLFQGTQHGISLGEGGFSRRRFLTLVSATAAVSAFGLATPLVASAAAADAFTGSLPAHAGADHGRYLISNPTGSKLTITLVYTPWHAGAAHRVGFAVWQGGKKVHHGSGQATGLHDHVNSNTVTATITPKAGEPLLIKTFNYSRFAVDYTLTVSGATAESVPLKPASAAPTAFKSPESGSLSGTDGGDYASYEIAAPTGAKLSFTMTFSPYNAGEAHSVGFSVWQGGKRILRKHGQATGFKDHTNSNTPTGSVTPKAGEPLLIKVFNFSKAPIDYTLTVK